jgi:uncharacterized protein DUF1631
VDLPDWHDYLEVVPLKLRSEHFPLPCSLREPVLERYVDTQASAQAALAMELDELIAYLRNADNDELSPMEAILAQTESIGDPALPTTEQTAVLRWLGAAIDDWEQRFTLEEPLASQLRRLKPLAAVLAITDPQFLTPGAHPLHQLLDTIQLNAVGWQPRLGRAGQTLEKQVINAVDSALAWFEAPDTDLTAISARMLANAERDQARAGRMAQRVIETEQGRLKTADAKHQAASMINAALEQYPAPVPIGEFLKGHWYDSAQLVLLKFGADSDQWHHMSTTTTTLLDSVQTPESEASDRRQHIFEVVAQLPKELKRWLLSLQHDSEAANDAVGLIEFIHLRVLRQQEIELEKISPIATARSKQLDEEAHKALERLQVGQWFLLDTGQGEPLRARLVLRLDSEQQLLFSNQAGIKALQQSFTEFVALMNQGKVKLLDSGASFSRALAAAAGITTHSELEAISETAAIEARREREEQAQEQQRQQQELEQQQRLQQQREEAQRQQREQEEAERLQREQAEAEQQAREQAEADQLQREWDEAERAQRERARLELKDQAELLKQREQAEQLRREESEARLVRQQQWREQATTATEQPASGQPAPSAPQPAQEQGQQLNLPMGAWLGFHDGDTPLLAKLAVHDREQDSYTFVNRSGIKMRQLSTQQLALLIERGLVEVLETRSRFRDEISRARQQSEE